MYYKKSRIRKQRRSLLEFVLDFFLSPKFFVVSFIFVLGFITVMTLMHSMGQVTKGYQLRALEEEYQKLLTENQIMDMQISDVRSIKFVQESAKNRNMIDPDRVVFIDNNTSIASLD